MSTTVIPDKIDKAIKKEIKRFLKIYPEQARLQDIFYQALLITYEDYGIIATIEAYSSDNDYDS
mgnify:CR=1 FL=1